MAIYRFTNVLVRSDIEKVLQDTVALVGFDRLVDSLLPELVERFASAVLHATCPHS